MLHLMENFQMVAAAGYSVIYLIAGGGIGGAAVIFVVAKLLGK